MGSVELEPECEIGAWALPAEARLAARVAQGWRELWVAVRIALRDSIVCVMVVGGMERKGNKIGEKDGRGLRRELGREACWMTSCFGNLDSARWKRSRSCRTHETKRLASIDESNSYYNIFPVIVGIELIILFIERLFFLLLLLRSQVGIACMMNCADLVLAELEDRETFPV